MGSIVHSVDECNILMLIKRLMLMLMAEGGWSCCHRCHLRCQLPRLCLQYALGRSLKANFLPRMPPCLLHYIQTIQFSQPCLISIPILKSLPDPIPKSCPSPTVHRQAPPRGDIQSFSITFMSATTI
jgi:hypothetical protein